MNEKYDNTSFTISCSFNGVPISLDSQEISFKPTADDEMAQKVLRDVVDSHPHLRFV